MYQPQSHRNNHPEFLFHFIENHPFAIIVLPTDPLLATHIPLLPKGDSSSFCLFGHIANHNPMRKYLKDGLEMLCIFHGPHTYVSSSLYSKPDISTWDYSAVHVNARITVQNDKELEESLHLLITHFEKQEKNPLFAEDIPKGIWEENFKEITGFWLEIFKIQGISKWHNNFDSEERKFIAEKLSVKILRPEYSTEEIIKNIYDPKN